MKSLLRNLFVIMALVAAPAVMTSCDDDDTDNTGLELHYPTIVDIGPSMSFTTEKPTYKGDAPSQFEITAVKLDGNGSDVTNFTINADNGAITIAGTENMAVGTYTLSIRCVAANRTYAFDDIFTLRLSPSTPEGITITATEVDIAYDKLTADALNVEVVPEGESVTIVKYSIPQEEGKEYFVITQSSNGDNYIRLNKDMIDKIEPAEYNLSLTIETLAGKNTYANILKVRITSLPLGVAYTPAEARMEQGTPFTSAAPVMTGFRENVVWAIKSTTPATDQIVIDPATGVLSVAAGNSLAVGDEIKVDVTVTNSFGSADFAEVFKLTVIDYIEPIDPATFAYDAVEVIQTGAFAQPKKEGFVGDEAAFALGELPAELQGQIEIDVVTGEVSAQKGHTIPVGTYEIPVLATNSKNLENPATATLKLTVVENPYHFTRIVYGNNLGLEPAENYANQYHVAKGADLAALELVPTTDAKEGVELEWSIQIKHQMKNTKIDASTGKITATADGFKGTNGGLVFVTATAGKGTAGETTVRVPVFFSFNTPINGVTVIYKPFVLQVNPRKGGRSAAPTLDGVADQSKFMLDYRRTFNYYNFGGPESHVEGQPNVAGSFLNHMWTVVYTKANGNHAGTGSKDAVSYYTNKSNPELALHYVDPETYQVVVNPNKWVDSDNKAANGMFIGQMTFITDADGSNDENDLSGHSTNRSFPLWIWFSEEF